ncbi:MAG: hypothetical protein P1Q69_00520 [Candidatus Thorarchaeota archaeon]|nr:hypothetical protein [Candidatus Thorarchaeota archaeon]
MKKNVILSLILAAILLVPFLSTTASGYSDIIGPKEEGKTVIRWNVVEAPETPVAWLNQSYAVLGNWSVEIGNEIAFEVMEVGASNSYLEGIISIGNFDFVMTANNSLIAYNLVLAISNFVSPWKPGLVIPTGTANIEAENASAYTAAARVLGNYLNGTVESKYERLTAGGVARDCISWDYVQDPSGFGEPQRTYLAYDLVSGVLVRANTSVNFGTPYNLVLELKSIEPPLVFDLSVLGLYVGGLGVVAIAAIVIIFFLRRK